MQPTEPIRASAMATLSLHQYSSPVTENEIKRDEIIAVAHATGPTIAMGARANCFQNKFESLTTLNLINRCKILSIISKTYRHRMMFKFLKRKFK